MRFSPCQSRLALLLALALPAGASAGEQPTAILHAFDLPFRLDGFRFDQPALDLTLSDLEGCCRELRTGSTMAVERRGAKKFVTRWRNWSRGWLALEPRDALFFVREPFAACHSIQFP